ncbi:MAG: beta-lactamase family protein [Thermoanaerobaculia bacterium]|nr:beta-lactamase family protein [Thermoanaerobaculia bacterium]
MGTNRYRMILFSLLTLLALVAQGSEEQERRQEAIAMAWVAAHNAADIEIMAAFRAQHFKRSEVTAWQDGYWRAIAQLGSLEVFGVGIDDEGAIAIEARPEHDDEQLYLIFAFHEDAPDQIASVSIEMADGPDDPDGLPDLDLDGDWQQMGTELDVWLHSLAREGLFSGAVLVAIQGEVKFEGAYGMASREFSAPNDLDTRFDVGSCNKDYTRVAILQLRAQGKLALDDTVGKHLPDYPNDIVRERVTIQQLLEHRSGLGDYFTEEYGQTPMSNLRRIEDYIPIWGPKPLLSEPGSEESYSNFGYTVLGAIIEEQSGQSYPDYVAEHVFEPAGMTRSGFFETDAVVPNVAVGYTSTGLHGPLEEPIKNIYLEPAKGGPWGKSYSTVRDLYRFYDSMMRGRILEGEDNWLEGSWTRGGIMLGGAGPGLNAMMSLEEGVMVIVLANMDPPIAESVALRVSREVRQ